MEKFSILFFFVVTKFVVQRSDLICHQHHGPISHVLVSDTYRTVYEASIRSVLAGSLGMILVLYKYTKSSLPVR